MFLALFVRVHAREHVHPGHPVRFTHSSVGDGVVCGGGWVGVGLGLGWKGGGERGEVLGGGGVAGCEGGGGDGGEGELGLAELEGVASVVSDNDI